MICILAGSAVTANLTGHYERESQQNCVTESGWVIALGTSLQSISSGMAQAHQVDFRNGDMRY